MENFRFRFNAVQCRDQYSVGHKSIKSFQLSLLMLLAVINVPLAQASWSTLTVSCGTGGNPGFAMPYDYVGACRNSIQAQALNFCGTIIAGGGVTAASCGSTNYQNYYFTSGGPPGSCAVRGAQSQCGTSYSSGACSSGGSPSSTWTYSSSTNTCTCKSGYYEVDLPYYIGTGTYGTYVMSPAYQCVATSSGCPSGTTLIGGVCNITSAPVCSGGWQATTASPSYIQFATSSGNVCTTAGTGAPSITGSNGLTVNYSCGGTGSYTSTCGVSQPMKAAGKCTTCQQSTGDPINSGNGNHYETATDYSGAGPFALQFIRTYNSNPSITIQDGWIGTGWRHSYSRSLQLSASTYNITAIRPDGKAYQYTAVATQTTTGWQPDNDVTDILTSVSGGYQLKTHESDEIEAYNSSGVLQSITNRAGLTQTMSYDGSGRLSTVTDTFGRTLTFTYDSSNRISTMTDPAGGTFTYTYDSNNNLATVTYPDTTVLSYEYNESTYTSGANLPNALTGITDENSNRYAYFGYDTSGNGIMSEFAGGANLTTLSYSGSTTTVTDALSTARTYTNSTYLGVAKNTGINTWCKGCISNVLTYDPYGNTLTSNDWNGNRTTYTYSYPRNLEATRTEGQTSTGGSTSVTRIIATTWNSTYRLPATILEKNSSSTVLRTTTNTYDSYGNLTEKTIQIGSSGATRSWNYTYNSNGQVLTATDPNTNVTTYTYYANAVTCTGMTSSTGCRGQLDTITNAALQVTQFTNYNAQGQPLSFTDPNGLVSALTYDARMRLTSITKGSEATYLTHDSAGQLTRVTLPDSSYLNFTYDNAHRLTQIIDALGNEINYTLDAMGNRTADNVYNVSSTLVQTRSRVFNTLNQLYQDIGAASQTTNYTYDNQGNLTSIEGPLGTTETTTQTFDQLNRLNRITNPLSGQINYTLNQLDQITQISDPRSKNTTYTISALNNVTQTVSPDTGTSSATFDNAGNVLTSTDARSKTTTNVYDVLNRITSATYADSTAVSYTYDQGTYGLGHLTTVTFPGGVTTYTYDINGDVTQQQDAYTSGPTLTTSYSWNSTTGQLSTVTYPSGQVLTYAYDSDGHVSSITVGTTVIANSITYFPFGMPSGWTWGNSDVITRSYDTDGRVSGFELTPASSRTLTYDAASRITGFTDPLNSSNNLTLGYDLKDEVTSWASSSTNYGYTYDANGNRSQLTIGTTNYAYTISTTSNRLTATAGPSPSRSFTIDAAGNVTGDGTDTWSFNARGRMASATVGSNTATYTYDGLGQRVVKSGPTSLVPIGTGYYAYDTQGHLIGEYNSSGNVIQEYVYLNNTLFAMVKGTTSSPIIYYVYTDQIGRPWVISDTSDNIVWRWDTSPFGELVPNQNPSGMGTFIMNLQFPGQYFDSETSMSYNYYRDYDSRVGRYSESDPIGLSGGINTYVYTNNPLSEVDPYGLIGRAAGRGPYPQGYGPEAIISNIFNKLDIDAPCFLKCRATGQGICIVLGYGSGKLVGALTAAATAFIAPEAVPIVFSVTSKITQTSVSLACGEEANTVCAGKCKKKTLDCRH